MRAEQTVDKQGQILHKIFLLGFVEDNLSIVSRVRFSSYDKVIARMLDFNLQLSNPPSLTDYFFTMSLSILSLTRLQCLERLLFLSSHPRNRLLKISYLGLEAYQVTLLLQVLVYIDGYVLVVLTTDWQYTKTIKEQKDLIYTMSDQLAEEKNIVRIKQTKISELEECLRQNDFENEHLKSKVVDFTTVQNLQVQVNELLSKNEHLKSKVVDCTMCQNLQVHVTKLKSVNESLDLSVEELCKARALTEATLRERDEIISAQCEKMQLLEEQSESFYEVPSEFDSKIVHDTQDNSKNDLILSLQTQLKEIKSLKDEIKSLQTENKVLKSKETELINLEKVYGVKESELLEKIEQMKSQVSEILKKLKISDQEMKQQIIF
uniref:Uncharacterized protein n=1 Tax=Tanacetum cinerariifolium TaxID=118510 RepID=A0A699GLX3_TANCI|nr:hypothetical protein [Tanacetum cinerariifolium]